MFKLPLAFIAGIRVQEISEKKAIVKVKHRWISQNPFKSMFWAVQGMASELSSGILVMQAIVNSEKKVSMLVTQLNGNFFKKATGQIQFVCNDGVIIKNAIQQAVKTGESQTVLVTSKGINQQGDVVAVFEFEWSLKLKG